MDELLSIEQLKVLHETMDVMLSHLEQEEKYEQCVIVKSWQQVISDYTLGYTQDSTDAIEIAYRMCFEYAEPMAAYKESDDYVVTFILKNLFFQFFIDSRQEYLYIRKKIQKNKTRR